MGYLDNTCAVIADGVTFDCAAPPIPGVLADILVINKSDVSTVSTGASDSITDIALASGGKVAYRFQGIVSTNGPSTAPSWELDTSGIFPGFRHSVQIHILDKAPATKAMLNKLARGTYYVIVETPEQTDEPFVVFGLSGATGHGLVMTEATRDFNSSDTGGVPVVTLATPGTLKEAKAPVTWFDTDYATTAAAVADLLTPTP